MRKKITKLWLSSGGIASGPQYNGKTARVIGQRGERWAVELADGKIMSLKADNLVLSPPASRRPQRAVQP